MTVQVENLDRSPVERDADGWVRGELMLGAPNVALPALTEDQARGERGDAGAGY